MTSVARTRTIVAVLLLTAAGALVRGGLLRSRVTSSRQIDEMIAEQAGARCRRYVGTYRSSDGFVGTALELAADCTASFGYWDDSGGSWQETALIELARGSLRVGSEADEHRPHEWWIVPWSRRLYLVPLAQIRTFCNLVNAGAEPSRTPWILVRGAERRRAPDGLPVVPAAFEGYLLAAPLEGTILEVLRPAAYETRTSGCCRETVEVEKPVVRVDLGSGDGLLPGMVLYGFNPRRPSFWAEIEAREIEADTAVGMTLWHYAAVRAGDRVSTRDRRADSDR